MMAEELKQCPFCASTDIDHEAWASTESKGPGCMDCGATAETVEIWNTRPSTPPAVSDDLVEEIAAALDEWIGCTETTSEMARAILPIIHRREQQAAEVMREKCALRLDREWPGPAAGIVRSLTTEVGEGKGAQ